MLMFMLLALGCAFITDARAELEHLAQDLLICPGSPHRELARRFANVGAVEADSNALPHVHLFSGTRIGAAETHPCAVHKVVCRIPKRLVDVPGNTGVKCDHLADRHPDLCSSFMPFLASEAEWQRFR